MVSGNRPAGRWPSRGSGGWPSKRFGPSTRSVSLFAGNIPAGPGRPRLLLDARWCRRAAPIPEPQSTTFLGHILQPERLDCAFAATCAAIGPVVSHLIPLPTGRASPLRVVVVVGSDASASARVSLPDISSLLGIRRTVLFLITVPTLTPGHHGSALRAPWSRHWACSSGVRLVDCLEGMPVITLSGSTEWSRTSRTGSFRLLLVARLLEGGRRPAWIAGRRLLQPGVVNVHDRLAGSQSTVEVGCRAVSSEPLLTRARPFLLLEDLRARRIWITLTSWRWLAWRRPAWSQPTSCCSSPWCKP